MKAVNTTSHPLRSAGSVLFGALITVALLGLVAPPVLAEDPSDDEKSHQFAWANEQLYYSVRVNGVEAVRAAIRVGDVRYKEGRPYVAISGTAQSTGIFHNIYPMDDRAHTFLHPTTLRPLRSEKFFHEAGKKRNYKVDYIHSTYQARVVKERPLRDRTRKFTKAIPGTTHDAITWFYELRARKKLHPGQELVYYVYDGWKLSKLEARVVKKEDVYTPMGWFKAYRIDFVRKIMVTKSKKGQQPILKVSKPRKNSGSMWVSRDDNMLPIKIRVDSKFGAGEAVLIKYQPGRKL